MKACEKNFYLLSGLLRQPGIPTISFRIWSSVHGAAVDGVPWTILPAQPVMHSAAMLALATTLVATPFPAHAARTIGEIQGSGLVFKDTLKVEAFSDPKVSGVQLYLSDFQRPAAEKLAKGDLVRSRLLWRPAPPAPALTACLLVMCDSSATPARAG